MEPTANSFLSIIDAFGTMGVLVVIIVGGIRRWYIWGHHHDELKSTWKDHFDAMERDRDEWKQIALTGTSLSSRAVNLVEKTADVAKARR